MSGRGRGRGRGRGKPRGARGRGQREGARETGRQGQRWSRGDSSGGRGRGSAGQRSGRGTLPDLSNLKTVITNILPAKVSDNFSFYQYSVDCMHRDGRPIESRSRRSYLFNIGVWDSLLSDMPEREKNDLRRVVSFQGSFFFSARPIPGLEKSSLPFELVAGDTTEGDTMTCVGVSHFSAPTELSSEDTVNVGQNLYFDSFRCRDCSQSFGTKDALLQHFRDSDHSPVYREEVIDGPASPEVFVAFVNAILQKALGERLAKWGREFVDPTSPMPARDRNGDELGVDIYEAYGCTFGLICSREAGKSRLALTCDLRAKVIRNKSVLDALYNSRSPGSQWTRQEQERAKRDWIGQVVIYKRDKKCYTVVDLDFANSARSLKIPGKQISHEEYFQGKGTRLKYPDSVPMIVVLNRREDTIFLPPELVAGNELDSRVREQLPKIASFTPQTRNQAIEKIKAFLIPGAQRTRGAGGLLPAIGVILQSDRLPAPAEVLPLPLLMAGGIKVPERSAENWAPVLNKARFDVNPRQAIAMNVVVFYHSKLKSGASEVYKRIREMVNSFQARYVFGEKPYAIVEAGDNERHWGAVERFFSGELPDNLFVLDFTKPRGALDPAYPVIKRMLAASGHLSQFVNFKTYAHDYPRDPKRSNIILQGIARQILQKSGVRLWFANIPKSLPLPAVFVGVDVFHAPVVYDPKTKKRGRKASCAAIIVQLFRSHSGSSRVELYSETFKRAGGNEYELGDGVKQALSNALRIFKIDPLSVVVWRDGIAETAFQHAATEEIAGIRRALDECNLVATERKKRAHVAYIVCQKRVATKFLTRNVAGHQDGAFGAPSGTYVQGLQKDAFYINGRAPPFSTPKPVRFIIVQRDEGLTGVSVADLTWSQCHDYPNWTGPIKVPSVCQMAHKLAELAGSFNDCGETIDSTRLANTIHFL